MEPLARLSDIIDDLVDAVTPLEGDSNVAEQAATIKLALIYVRNKIDNAIPSLFTAPDLTVLEKHTSAIKAHLTGYHNNKATTDINAINGHLHSLLATAENRIHMIQTPADAKGLAAAFQSSADEIARTLNLFKELNSKTQADLDRNFQELTLKSQAAMRTLADLQDEIKAEKQNVSTTLSTLQEEFRANEKERGASYQAMVDDLKKRGQDSLENLKASFAKFESENVATFLDSLEDTKKKAEELLNLISVTGMAAGYEQAAKDDEAMADDLRKSGIVAWWVAAVGAIAVIVATFFVESSPLAVLGRALLIAMMAAPATYLSRESSKHRREAKRARRYSLELVALNPYLAPLKENEREAMILMLTSKYFGHIEDGGEEDEGTILASQKILNECVERVKAGVDKVGKE